MERRWLADILLIKQAMLNQPFGDEPSPLHFRFQAAVKVLQRFQPENTKRPNLKHPFHSIKTKAA